MTNRIRLADHMYAVPFYFNGALWDVRIYLTGTLVDVPVPLSDLSTAQLVTLSEAAHAPLRGADPGHDAAAACRVHCVPVRS